MSGAKQPYSVVSCFIKYTDNSKNWVLTSIHNSGHEWQSADHGWRIGRFRQADRMEETPLLQGTAKAAREPKASETGASIQTGHIESMSRREDLANNWEMTQLHMIQAPVPSAFGSLVPLVVSCSRGISSILSNSAYPSTNGLDCATQWDALNFVHL